MKKLSSFLVILAFIGLPFLVSAQTIGNYPAGHSCSASSDCAGQLICANNICASDSTDPNSYSSTGQPLANPSNSGTTNSGATTGGASTGVSAFSPLTALPGISNISASSSNAFPTFINSLYKICIGIAATLAVIIIMKAGIEFAGNTGSISGNEKAKNDLQNAILGLVLVLSPAIVFGIINPKILDLSLNFSSLQPATLQNLSGTTNGAGSGSTSNTCTNFTNFSIASDNNCSNLSGGSFVQVDNSCCSGMQTGAACCALNSNSAQSCTPPHDEQCPGDQICLASGKCGMDTSASGGAQGTSCKTTSDCGEDLLCSPSTLTCQPSSGSSSSISTSQWGWQGTVQSTSGQQTTAKRGPFTTQKACQDDITSYTTQNNLQSTGDFKCNCNTPFNQQTGCSF